MRSPQKIAFLHIPKTGGTYVSKLKLNMEYWGHSSVVDLSRKGCKVYPHGTGMIRTVPYSTVKQHYVFAVVRNIYAWLVSYAGHAGGWNPQYCDTNHYDYKASNNGFDYLLKTIANRDAGVWPNRKLVFFQLFCDNTEFIVDRLLRSETLDHDLCVFASELGFKYKPMQNLLVGKHSDYRTYYTDELIQLFQDTWGRELKLFGHMFEGNTSSQIVFNKTIDKTKYKYNYVEDKLYIV